MKKITVDSDVLIDVLTSKKIPEEKRKFSLEFVKQKIEFGDYIGYISAFTCFEIYKGAKSEHANAKKLISLFNEVGIDCKVAEKAGNIRRRYIKSDGDSIIAATSLLTGSSHLITWNKKDYVNIKKLRILTPEEGLERL